MYCTRDPFMPPKGTYWHVAIKLIEFAEMGAYHPDGTGLFELFARERRYWSDYISDQSIPMEETLHGGLVIGRAY